MPTATSSDFNRDGRAMRICSRCSLALELTPENFQHRADNGWIDRRCQSCRREVDRQNRAARRAARRAGDGRQFGVEIEYIGDRYAVGQEMTNRGLACAFEGYTHRVREGQWKIVTDASISSGYELVSPPLSGAEGRRQVKLACEALAAAGARVNRSCGLHVHHDVSDLDVRSFGRLFRGWYNSQPAIDKLVAASRRGSQWAEPLREREVASIEQLRNVERRTVQSIYVDRYRALNVACFPRQGTVEVRQHQGTTNAAKILAWIAFGQAMIARAKSDAEQAAIASPHRLLDLLAPHGLDASTVTYLKGRAAAFGTPSPERVMA